ncbi:MAG: cytochrome C [Cyclobacteriaceae bacterium]
MKDILKIVQLTRWVTVGALLVVLANVMMIYLLLSPPVEQDSQQEVVAANLPIDLDEWIDAEGVEIVAQNCAACHSAKLVTQNRATKEGWLSIIRWMQSTQNLWDLGENEAIILKYLSENYAPQKKGRRTNLESIEWYKLK